MSHGIKAYEQSISKLFCDDFLFSVPSFQRPYAWSPEQAGELLDDLEYSLRLPGEPSPYFLGTIVVIKDEASPACDIVDGQQRLATLTILLSVLRDLSEESYAAEIDDYVRQKGKQILGIPDRYRLTLRDQDAALFQSKVQKLGATKTAYDPQSFESDSQTKLIEVVNFYRTILQSRTAEARGALLRYIVSNCFLVVVQASNREAAYRVFAVMNDRGLDLSPTDVLKAELLGSIPADQRDLYIDIWEIVEEGLGRDRFRDLFGHIVMQFEGQKRRSSLEHAFRQNVLNRMDAATFISDYLRPYGEAYFSIVDCRYRSTVHADQINKCLRNLGKLDYSDWEPAAIKAMVKFQSSPADLLEALTKIERLAYIFFFCCTHVNVRIKRFTEVSEELQRGVWASQRGSALLPTKTEIKETVSVLDGPIYPVTRIRKLLLLRLDEAISDGSASYDYPIISVEHVLPQRPAMGSEWEQHFPDTKARSFWVHRLANLVLLSRRKNASASNLEFDAKKERYFKAGGVCPFAITTQVLTSPVWNVDVLQQRQDALTGKLKEMFALN